LNLPASGERSYAMPKIKCDYGHIQTIGTDEWLTQLTLDQLKYARDEADKIIKKAKEAPRRTVWQVVIDDCIIEAIYREEDHRKASDHLLRIYGEKFAEEAAHFNESPCSAYVFNKQLPKIVIERVTQFEYDTEYFPAK
jgi:hypothetical protein